MGSQRRLHNEELHSLYTSSNVMVMEQRRMLLVEHVACIRDEKGILSFGWKNLKGRNHSEDLGVGGKIILE
jgi:hypothetical protein